jgi:PST family polysaccharide transporter
MAKKQKNFKEKTLSGVLWSAVGTLGLQAFALAFGLVLMAMLPPEDFGDFAMVFSIVGFSTILLDFGFGQALINKRNADDLDFSSVFWLNTAIGIVLFALIWLISGPLSQFYATPRIKEVTQALSLVFFINALGVVQRAHLMKNLRLKQLAMTEILSALLSWGGAVLMAYMGYGIWSLVGQRIVQALAFVTFLWIASGWRPSFAYQSARIKEIMNFSLNLFANQSVNYLANNIDKVLIGKFVGAGAVGIYGRSYSIVMRPTNSINQLLYKVFFPTYSNIQEEDARVREIHKGVAEIVFLLVGTFMSVLFFMAEPLIQAVYDEEWYGMIPIVQALCAASTVVVISMVHGNVYLAKGRSGLLFKVNLASRIITILGIVIGLQFGIFYVAVSLIITFAVRLLLSSYFLERLVGFTIGDLFQAMVRPLGILLPILMAGWVCEYYDIGIFVQILFMLSMGALFFLLIKPPLYHQAVELLNKKRR